LCKFKEMKLARLRGELVHAHDRAVWAMAETILQASLTANGMDEPPTASELENLEAAIDRLRSVADDTIEELTDITLSHEVDSSSGTF